MKGKRVMSKTHAQVALTNVRTNKRKATQTPADNRHLSKQAKMIRYNAAKGQRLSKKDAVLMSIADGAGSTPKNIQDYAKAMYGHDITLKYVYQCVYQWRKNKYIVAYNNAYTLTNLGKQRQKHHAKGN